MRKVILAILFAGMILMSASAYADDVTITATVGNQAPTITILNVYDTGGLTTTLAPATEFTVEVTVTDPNGSGDIDTGTFSVELYTTADTNGGTPDWDAIVDDPPTTGSANTCTEAGDTYCLTVGAGDWTTKFVAGLADVYVYVEDLSAEQDSDENVSAVTVSDTTGFTPDATTGTYSGSPNSTDNAFDNGQTVNAYITTTHNGNVNLDVTGDQSDLVDGGNTIGDGNVSWHLSDVAGSSTPFTGGADAINSGFTRGSDPTSNTFDLYMWLDIPANQPAGDYGGTLQILASAS